MASPSNNFQLNFNVCVVNNCSQIKFTETTGAYSTSNLGGYGTPNIDISDVVSCYVDVTSPSGELVTINMITAGFPSSVSLDRILTLNMLAVSAITDGKWIITYRIITDTELKYTVTKTKLFYCNSECCISQKLANLEITDCDCCKEDKSYADYVLTKTMLDSLKNAAKCGDMESFDKIKKIIDKLCLNNGCKTCK